MTQGLVGEWLEHLRLDLGKSPNTVATYARTLRTLPDPEGSTRDDVRAWARSRSGLAPSSRNNEMAAVRSFYRWARRFDRLPTDVPDPSEWLEPVKAPKTLPRPASRDDLARALDAADDEVRRAICLGAWGGLRVSEAAAANWRDLDAETRRLRVRGKGQKERLVGVSALLLDSILPDTGANIVTGGRALTVGALERRCNRAFDAAGLTVTFHQLRHRFGTLAYAETRDLYAVARAMGHASTNTTQLYAAASDDALDVIAQAVVR